MNLPTLLDIEDSAQVVYRNTRGHCWLKNWVPRAG